MFDKMRFIGSFGDIKWAYMSDLLLKASLCGHRASISRHVYAHPSFVRLLAKMVASHLLLDVISQRLAELQPTI